MEFGPIELVRTAGAALVAERDRGHGFHNREVDDLRLGILATGRTLKSRKAPIA